MIDKKTIYLCAINNIESGTCSEDCTFCTQSVKYKASIERYKRKPIENIINEAKIAMKNKAIGYCLVTAGVGLDDERLKFVCQTASILKKEIPNINLIACNGLASKEQLKELKKAGINRYNHNLESSSRYYKEVCTTHSWDSRYETCENIKSLDMKLICGGIFGMGENNEDRISMLNSIKSLNPTTVPLNFFHPNEALPTVQNTLDIDIAFSLIKKAKDIINPHKLMVAGGREITFQNRQYEIFKYGANSIVIGDYLTTKGNSVLEDFKALELLNFNIASSCDGNK
jgi:biotin synthase